MAAFLLDGGDRPKGVSMESMAEEVLNGLFCHYEPPTSEKAQRKAAKAVRENPLKYSYSPRRNKSILRPSRMFRKSKKQPQKRGVTWRDEQRKDNIELQVESFASACDLLGTSRDETKGGLADSKSYDNTAVVEDDGKSPTGSQTRSQPQSNRRTAPLKDSDGPSKKTSKKPVKVLYDDEGNPITEDGENIPPSPSSTLSGGDVPPPPPPPPPRGTPETPQMSRGFLCSPFGQENESNPPPPPAAAADDDDGVVAADDAKFSKYGRAINEEVGVYEPEDYDRPPSSQALPYRRMRSPPVRAPTPRTTRSEEKTDEEEDNLDESDDEFLQRVGKVPRSRSRSPEASASRRYERLEKETLDGDDNEVSTNSSFPPTRSPRGAGLSKRMFGRRGTSSKKDDVVSDTSNDVVDYQADENRGRSSSRDRGTATRSSRGRSPQPRFGEGDGHEYYSNSGDDRRRSRSPAGERTRGSRPTRSPGRRSDVYSDLTDEYFNSSNSRRTSSRSPRRGDNDGVEVEYYEGRRSRSRSASRSPSRPVSFARDDEVVTDDQYGRSARDHEERRRFSEFDAEVERRRSREYDESIQRRATKDYDEEGDRRRSADGAYSSQQKLQKIPTRDYDEEIDRRRSRGYGEEVQSRPTRDYDDDVPRRRSRDYGDELQRRPTRDFDDEYAERRRSRDYDDYDSRRRQPRDGGMQTYDEEDEGRLNAPSAMSPRSMRRSKRGYSSKSRDSASNGDDREPPRSSEFVGSNTRDENGSIQSDQLRRRYETGDGGRRLSSGSAGSGGRSRGVVETEQGRFGGDEKYRQSRRDSDPVPNRSRSSRGDEEDGPGYDAHEMRRPHSTSSSRRGPVALDTSYDEREDDRNRDPTPRMDREMQYGNGNDSFNEALPPTPRRDEPPTARSYNDRVARSSPSGGRSAEVTVAAAVAAAHSRRPAPLRTEERHDEEKIVRSRRAAMRQLSPTSMATDDEIREEVSSVGMESHTLRPVNYPNPFLRVPPRVLEDDVIEEEEESERDDEPSTLSESDDPSKLTLTSSDTTSSGKDGQPQQQTRALPPQSNREGGNNKEGKDQDKKQHPDIEESNSGGSGTTKSKKLWRGWRKAVGKVKSIVHDIDEKRIPPPADLNPGKKKSKQQQQKQKQKQKQSKE